MLKMIDTLSSDIEKEMAVAKTEEEDAQEDYQETIADAAKTLGLPQTVPNPRPQTVNQEPETLQKALY